MSARYLIPYICFECRRVFKRRPDRGAPDKVCPHCGGPAIGLSRKFRVPARADEAQWKKVEFLVRRGFRFYSVYDDHHVAVPYPDTLAAARDFVRRFADQSTVARLAKVRQRPNKRLKLAGARK